MDSAEQGYIAIETALGELSAYGEENGALEGAL